MSVSGLIFVKNMTRWLCFLTLVKHWRIGTGFALIAVSASVNHRVPQTRNN